MGWSEWIRQLVGGVSAYKHEQELKARDGIIAERDRTITELKAQLEVKQKLIYREPYYWADGNPVPFCPKCWQSEKHAQVRLGPVEEYSGGKRRRCVVCDYMNWEVKPQPRQRRVISHGIDWVNR